MGTGVCQSILKDHPLEEIPEQVQAFGNEFVGPFGVIRHVCEFPDQPAKERWPPVNDLLDPRKGRGTPPQALANADPPFSTGSPATACTETNIIGGIASVDGRAGKLVITNGLI